MNNQDFRSLLSTSQPREGVAASTRSTPQPSRVPNKAFAFAPRSVRNAYTTHNFGKKPDGQGKPRPGQGTAKTAPKGVKLAEGYVDRAKLRAEAQKVEDLKVAELRKLELQLEQNKIDVATFKRKRDEILNRDGNARNRAKGLDMKLLERARNTAEAPREDEEKTPDAASGQSDSHADSHAEDVDEDAQFEAFEQKDVEAVQHDHVKIGNVATPAPVTGQKRTRDDLIKEMKARREAAAAAKRAALPALGSKFKKVQAGQQAREGMIPGSRIEIDEKGREALITVDASGKMKKKVRKVARQETDPSAIPIGADAVPEQYRQQPQREESEDEDIFAGAGTDYDPLARILDQDDSDEEAKAKIPEAGIGNEAEPGEVAEVSNGDLQAVPMKPRRKIFDDEDEDKTASNPAFNAMQDATVLAALRRANAEKEKEASEGTEEERRQKELQQRLLARQDRDMEDLDMGFGGDRGDDEDDGQRIKLSEWHDDGEDDDEDGDKKRGGAGQRKRGKKKRKGDKNSAADVLRVMAARK